MARLIFLTPQLPHPPVSGGVIKSRKLIEHLASKHEVYLFSLLKGTDAERVDELRATVPLAGFFSASVDVPRSAGNFLRSLAAGLPLSVYRNRSPLMQSLVTQHVNHAQILFVDHFLMFQYVPASFPGRIVLHQHNAEYMMWRRYAEVETNPLRRAAALAESKRIRRYERDIGRRSHAILAAPNDIEALVPVGIPRSRFRQTLHLGDEEMLQRADMRFEQTQLRLLFVGSLAWEANRDGLLWFLREVWPILVARHGELRLQVIGKDPGAELSAEAARCTGVELLGFVDDLEPHYRASRLFIAPLRFGSGIKVKVVNALYRGIPTVTTTVGAEGLLVEPGIHMSIADDAPRMADAISRLLTDEAAWTQMRDAARTLARREYTWESSLRCVDEALLSDSDELIA